MGPYSFRFWNQSDRSRSFSFQSQVRRRSKQRGRPGCIASRFTRGSRTRSIGSASGPRTRGPRSGQSTRQFAGRRYSSPGRSRKRLRNR